MKRPIPTTIALTSLVGVLTISCSSSSGTPGGTSTGAAGRGGASGASSGAGGGAGSESDAGANADGGAAGASGGSGGSDGAAAGAAGGGSGGASGSSMAGMAGGAGGATGGSGGAGNHAFAAAASITIGAPSASTGSLSSPASSTDYYSFSGTQGEVVQIVTATGAANPFDPTFVNVVVTLYGANQSQLAQDYDPWPLTSNAATLFTVLPATGTYYVLIDDCLVAAPSGNGCGSASSITNFGYSVRASDVGGASATDEGAEPGNGTTAGAAAVAYAKSGTAYLPSLIYGLFQSGGDTDVFAFNLPSDVSVAAGARARANFWIEPSGMDGDGSAVSPGNVWITAADGTTVLAEVDDTAYGDGRTARPAEISLPVTLGQQYYLMVQSASSASGDYSLVHDANQAPSAPAVEPEVATASGQNDTRATATPLVPTSNADGTHTFTVDGNIGTTGDVDWYQLNIPAGASTISGSCQSARIGSGVIGLSYIIYATDGATTIAQQTESTTADASIAATSLAGATVVYLKVASTSQSSTVTGTSYLCSLEVGP